MVDDGYIGWKNDMVKSAQRRRLNLRDGGDWIQISRKFGTRLEKDALFNRIFHRRIDCEVVDAIDSSDVVINPPSIKVRKAELTMDDLQVDFSDLLRQKSTALNDLEITLPDPIAWLKITLSCQG